MYLISVYFDDHTNKSIRRYIVKIAEETGNTFMMDNRVPPHLTISQIEARGVDVLVPNMQMLEGKLKQGQIRFVSVGQLFPYVIYATPVLNEYLQGLSKQVYDAVSGIKETTVSRYYMPMSWLPHVTLGKTLSKIQMQNAFKVMQDRFVPFTGTVTELGLARTNPHEDVLRFKLG